MSKETPSMDQWLREARASENVEKCGMFLFHNGVVRSTAKAEVRNGEKDKAPVRGMLFAYDENKVKDAVEAARNLPGIYYVRAWLNSGELSVGDDIMLVLLGGDIRPHVVEALNTLVGQLKENCVTEKEVY